jgi:hypothetical protein
MCCWRMSDEEFGPGRGWCDPMRRLLSRKVSVESMLEFLLWAGLVHVLIGLVWSFVHFEQVERLEDGLRLMVPAGAEMVALCLTTLLWPMMLIASAWCGS